jgi:hypothetical protein
LGATLKVSERTLCELVACRLSQLHRPDRARTESTQPSRVIQQQEPLALSLERARGFASPVGIDGEDRGDRGVTHPIRGKREHASLELRELGEELDHDQPILIDQCGALRFALRVVYLREGAYLWRVLVEDLPAPALVATSVVPVGGMDGVRSSRATTSAARRSS